MNTDRIIGNLTEEETIQLLGDLIATVSFDALLDALVENLGKDDLGELAASIEVQLSDAPDV